MSLQSLEELEDTPSYLITKSDQERVWRLMFRGSHQDALNEMYYRAELAPYRNFKVVSWIQLQSFHYRSNIFA